MYYFIYLFPSILYNLFLLSFLNSRIILGFKSPSGYLTYFIFLHYYNIVTKMLTKKRSSMMHRLFMCFFVQIIKFLTSVDHM
jgi:hypothetical protein